MKNVFICEFLLHISAYLHASLFMSAAHFHDYNICITVRRHKLATPPPPLEK